MDRHTVRLEVGRPITLPRVQQPFRPLVLAIRRGSGAGGAGIHDQAPMTLVSSAETEGSNRITHFEGADLGLCREVFVGLELTVAP